MLTLIVLLACICTKISAEIHGVVQPLVLKEIHSVNPSEVGTRVDLSGLATDGERLYTVSDLSHLNDIYELEIGETETKLKVAYPLSSQFLKTYAERNQSFGRLDFEGISYCNEHFYIVNEHKRSVLKISPRTTVPEELVVPWDEFHDKPDTMNPFSGITNAGLEGIACDSQGQILYLFNERQFRMGYTYSLVDQVLLEQFDFPTAAPIPTPSGKTWMYPDFADAHFYQGKLYVLERNSRQVAVVNPKDFQVEGRFDYSRAETGLFQQSDGFGLAEGLVIHKGSLFIVLDNNIDPRTSDGSLWPYLLEFELP